MARKLNSQNIEFESQLINQFRNSCRPAQAEFLNFIYDTIQASLTIGEDESLFLEVGAGYGISKKFLGELNILRTDIINWKNSDVIGNIDGENLPFHDSVFDGSFAIDTLHHIAHPYALVSELLRVTKPGRRVVFIEPYVSLFSFPIFKLFHSERATWRFILDLDQQLVTLDPGDGDQGIPKSMFCSAKGKEIIRQMFTEDILVDVTYISPFSFFVTGGLTKPLPTPGWVVRGLIVIEGFIPQIFLKYISSRMIIIITRLPE